MVVSVEIELPDEVVRFLEWILDDPGDLKEYCEKAVIGSFCGDIDCGRWGRETIMRKLEEFKVALKDYGLEYIKYLT